MQYNLGLVARGLQPPPPFSAAKDFFFLHNIGVDESEGIDKKQQKLHTKEGMQPKGDISHENSSMYFFL